MCSAQIKKTLVDPLKRYESPTDNLKSGDASASKTFKKRQPENDNGVN